MSFFSQPLIFMPELGSWQSRRNRTAPGVRRQRFGIHPYTRALRRNPFDYIFDSPPFDYIYAEEYPEDLSDISDIPLACIGDRPKRRYGYELGKKPEKKSRKAKTVLEEGSMQNTDDESEKCCESAEKMITHDVPICMDLNEFIGRLATNLTGLESKRRDKAKSAKESSNEVVDKDKDVSGKTEKKTSHSQASCLESDENRHPLGDSRTNKENTDAKIEMSAKQIEDNEKSIRSSNDDDQPLSATTVDNSEEEQQDEERKDSENDSPKEETLAEVSESDCRKKNLSSNQPISEMECSPDLTRQGQMSESNSYESQGQHHQGDLVSNEIHPKKNEVDRMTDCTKFHMTFDLSRFLPEEIQVKLIDDRLILHALHEVIEEGIIEKQSIHREITLPTGVDMDSLRCHLGNNGEMKISAEYLKKRKQHKILTIEKHMD